MQDRIAGVLDGRKIGFAITGSHCTLTGAMSVLRRLKALGADIFPVISYSVRDFDTKFGSAAFWRQEIADICSREPIDSIAGAERLGPGALLDVLAVAPCSGNTLAKLACAITDTPVLMAAKAHLRNRKPLVLAVSTNDGLSGNAINLGRLLNTKHVFFVPFGQDSPGKKANSLVSDLSLLPETIERALAGEQLQPLLLAY